MTGLAGKTGSQAVLVVRMEGWNLQLLPRRALGIQIHSGAARLPGRVAAPGGVIGLPGLAFSSA